jgi:3-oxoacyl-[acyl-carrier protein] reductase
MKADAFSPVDSVPHIPSADDLRGRAFLVTGSTRGIGLAIARALLQQGATVGLHGRSTASVEKAAQSLPGHSGRLITVQADLAQPENAATLLQEFVQQAGRLDGLVNNAGTGRAVVFRGLTLPEWQQTFRLNLDAAFAATQAAYPLMRAQKRGSIVNIASIAAHGPGKWMGADYAASKAGLVSLTQSLAFEAGRFGIRVNAISPGFVETDMTAAIPAETRAAIHIPLGRFARPEEIAGPALFLLSDASAYLTGCVLHADGGLWMG